MSVESVMPSNHLIFCCPLVLLPSIFPIIRTFQWVSSLHQVAKVLELLFQHQSFQWIFRVDFPYDWLVWSSCCLRDSQESSQHFSWKASVLQCSVLRFERLGDVSTAQKMTLLLTRPLDIIPFYIKSSVIHYHEATISISHTVRNLGRQCRCFKKIYEEKSWRERNLD